MSKLFFSGLADRFFVGQNIESLRKYPKKTPNPPSGTYVPKILSPAKQCTRAILCLKRWSVPMAKFPKSSNLINLWYRRRARLQKQIIAKRRVLYLGLTWPSSAVAGRKWTPGPNERLELFGWHEENGIHLHARYPLPTLFSTLYAEVKTPNSSARRESIIIPTFAGMQC